MTRGTLLYALPLTKTGSPDNAKTYIRIPLTEDHNILLRFVLEAGSEPCGMTYNPTLHTTYPVEGTFDRSNFHALPFSPDSNSPVQARYTCDIHLLNPGAYEYHVTYKRENALHQGQIGYFVVEPRMYVGKTLLPLNALMIQSVIPKWLGPVSKWKPHMDLVKSTGYNMIHFAPMQQRGSSDSPYSIRDQLLFADDLFDDPNLSRQERVDIIRQVMNDLCQNQHILCLSDIVWNHTSHDSPLLKDHPDAGYNLHNAPHLVPAYELDTALLELSGRLEEKQLPTEITSEQDVSAIVQHIKTVLIPELKLWEYKIVNVKESVEALRQLFKNNDSKISTYDGESPANHPIEKQASLLASYAITKGHAGTRFNVSVDVSRAASFVLALAGAKNPTTTDTSQLHHHQQQQEQLLATYQRLLDQYNVLPYAEYDEDVRVALDNIASRIRFRYLDAKGPRLGRVSIKSPLLESYFTRLDPNANHPPGSMQLANNGWIWTADPTQDFAGPASSAYLRRQVICWGDCVKLRYGNSPKDNPWLWNHMKKYTEQIASIFHGIRIDNCHSTPIHVAEYLLDAARRIRPDLYVLAELFTGSPQLDDLFVSKLGIHALLREAMQAWDPHELSRLAHRHGGKPFGSMDEQLNWKHVQLKDNTTALMIPVDHGSMPRALFMDCTHDNETPFQKRTAEDSLPNAAIVAFSDCAVGSVKGYDELYPRLLDVVGEKRLYTPFINETAGIIHIKGILQKLHLEMSMQGYTEVHVHHQDDYIIVHRQHPVTHNGYLLIARTAFQADHCDKTASSRPVRLHMTSLEYIAGVTLKVDTSGDPNATKYLVGLPSYTIDLAEPSIEQLPNGKREEEEEKEEEKEEGTWYAQINLPEEFVPGSVYIFKTSLEHDGSNVGDFLTDWSCNTVENLDLLDCNVVLYRCEGEEMDATPGNGAYNIPNFGKMPYCGLEGFMSVLRPIIRNNDLGHPFCDNLRQGPWAMDYVVGRLSRYLPQYPHLEPLITWFRERFDVVKRSPTFLVPKYFSMTIHTAYNGVRAHAIAQMAPFVVHGDAFVQSLALCGVQMQGIAPSTGLHPTQITACLAAGLPHFTHGCMRTWGRDVFISLRGLLMVTGRFNEAKEHIVRFASTLRHGLIPNLLDAARNPRYNARDAVWWFMQAIQDYYYMAPDGKDILNARVKRRFPPNDDYVPVDQAFQWECSIAEIMQEIMQKHAQGIHFREHNAGPAIDSQMTDAGFNVDISLDWDSGVLAGGNEWNCGTWMDKMGESAKAGNKGHPGTSRDGAPVEITGLVKSALRWILQLNKSGEFQWTGVQINGSSTLTFQDWNDKIQKNFERIYYIPKDPAEDGKYAVDPRIINRRGIYKDVYKATHPYTEYQFRPNLCVAMVVAPELFDTVHAVECLKLMKSVLLGPLGMRTLDPSDLRYRPYYDNANDSDDYDIAKGRNYHQGPEWIWLLGYYLRAAYRVKAMDPEDISRILYAHRQEILRNPWAGLPELTNKDGETCWDSCFTQAWSASCILDLLYDLK